MLPPARNTNSYCFDLLDSRIVFCHFDEFIRLLKNELDHSGHYFFLTDSNTREYCLPLIREHIPEVKDRHVITIPAGEDNKNISSLTHIWERLQEGGAGRTSRIFNLGGGVVTDIGGFAAATFMRGVAFVNIPTTILGMADAAVGGKTAVNLGRIKNPVGIFALPETTLICPEFLKTLPVDEFLSGYAEVIKTGLALDYGFWERLYGASPVIRDQKVMLDTFDNEILARAVSLKARVVSEDLRDNGPRQCLNFGHSIGHAIEAFSMGKPAGLRHGFAVAAGMVCETYLSMKLAGLSAEHCKSITAFLNSNFPRIKIESQDIDDIVAFMHHDKKNDKGELVMSLLQAPGCCEYGIACPEHLIRESLSYYIHLS
ncbi:MAG TPA: 3-dehydroquinate synthase [Bacteroidales bacterium]|nr:3-dehydroquinate synthase [Bacteroidales bacterium]